MTERDLPEGLGEDVRVMTVGTPMVVILASLGVCSGCAMTLGAGVLGSLALGLLGGSALSLAVLGGLLWWSGWTMCRPTDHDTAPGIRTDAGQGRIDDGPRRGRPGPAGSPL